jgi:hypothetical protein
VQANRAPDAEARSLPRDAPADLLAALEQRRAVVAAVERGRFQHPGRTYFSCSSPEGRLHGHYSTTPADVPLFAYEVEIRRRVGAEGALRAPAVVAAGPGWMLAGTIEPEALAPGAAVDRVVEAAMRIAELDLPPSPWPDTPGGARALLSRRLRLLRSPLQLRDVAAARRTIGELSLPRVTSHGSYQRLHVFLADGAAWVIDWEQAGKRPLGYDLMTYWANLEDEETRSLLFDASRAALGRRHEHALRRLRYALLVRMIASKFADDAAPEEARRLLDRLPTIRAEAHL